MIATRNFRPLLQTGYCVVSDYDERWIESVLQEAADAAGVRLPFRAEIARAVLLYLEKLCPLPSVPLFQWACLASMDTPIWLWSTVQEAWSKR